jgi:hypothetical protein
VTSAEDGLAVRSQFIIQFASRHTLRDALIYSRTAFKAKGKQGIHDS